MKNRIFLKKRTQTNKELKEYTVCIAEVEGSFMYFHYIHCSRVMVSIQLDRVAIECLGSSKTWKEFFKNFERTHRLSSEDYKVIKIGKEKEFSITVEGL